MAYNYHYVAGYELPNGSWVEAERDGVRPDPFFQPFDTWDGNYVLAIVDDKDIAHYIYVPDGWDADYTTADAVDEYDDWEDY